MSDTKADAIGATRHLPGIKAWLMNGELRMVQRRDGKFMYPCPHCAEVYWRDIGAPIDSWGLPVDCLCAVSNAHDAMRYAGAL